MALLIALCSLAFSLGSTDADEIPKDIFVVRRHADLIYVAEHGEILERSEKDEDGKNVNFKIVASMVIHRAKWQGTSVKASVATFVFGSGTYIRAAQLNWRIKAEYFWRSPGDYSFGHIYKIALKDIGGYAEIPPKELAKWSEAKKFDYMHKQVYLDYGFNPNRSVRMEHWKKLDPELKEFANGFAPGLKPLKHEGTCNDFVPISKTDLLLFLIFEDTLAIYLGKTTVADEGEKIDEKAKYKIRATFTEPFHAYPYQGKFYFVTKTGKLYTWLDPGLATQKLEAVWTDAKSPIETIVDDQDSGKIYAFTQDGKAPAGEGLFFELGKEKETAAYKLKAWPQRDLPATMRKGFEFYQVIANGKAAKAQEKKQ